MGAIVQGGSEAFQTATDAFIDALREEVYVELTVGAAPGGLPPRGVRQWVNLVVKTWHFLGRWRSNIFDNAPPSVQAAIITIDVVLAVIEAMNIPGPE